jgi:hypothetical protein
VYSLARAHLGAATFGIGLLFVVAAVCLAYRTGRHAQATADAVSVLDARASAQAEHQLQLRLDADSLRRAGVALAATQAKLDSVQAQSRTESSARVATAAAVRSRARIGLDSVVITTGSTSATFAVPPEVAQTWARERTADTSAIAGLNASIRADSLSLAEREVRIRNLSDQMATADSIEAYQAVQITTLNNEVVVLKNARQPRLSFMQGVLVGTVGTIVTVVAAIIR